MTKRIDRPEIPAFACIDRNSDGHSSIVLLFWCPHCQEVHYHDRHGGIYLTGHCYQDNPKSPLVESGYILRVVGFVNRPEDLVPVGSSTKCPGSKTGLPVDASRIAARLQRRKYRP